MARILILLVIVAVAVADPLVYTSPYLPSPFITPYSYASPYSAALVAPGPEVATPVQALQAVQAVPAVPAVPAAVPLSSVSAYAYGSSYSVQGYAPLVNAPAANLYSSAYSLPYSYADWFYRR